MSAAEVLFWNVTCSLYTDGKRASYSVQLCAMMGLACANVNKWFYYTGTPQRRLKLVEILTLHACACPITRRKSKNWAWLWTLNKFRSVQCSIKSLKGRWANLEEHSLPFAHAVAENAHILYMCPGGSAAITVVVRINKFAISEICSVQDVVANGPPSLSYIYYRGFINFDFGFSKERYTEATRVYFLIAYIDYKHAP